jgi:hypothetical protein
MLNTKYQSINKAAQQRAFTIWQKIFDRPAADNSDCCQSQQTPIGFYCTKPIDHLGDHVAHDESNRELARWRK